MLWQFLASKTKSKQSIALLPLVSWLLRRLVTPLRGFLSTITGKLQGEDTYGQVPDLSPFPLNDMDCSLSVNSISRFVVARSNSSSLEPENVKMSRGAWSDFMAMIHWDVSTVTGQTQTSCQSSVGQCTFLDDKPWLSGITQYRCHCYYCQISLPAWRNWLWLGYCLVFLSDW